MVGIALNSSEFPDERNDCTVRAYSTAADIPYAEAHAEIAAAGRRYGQGFRVYNFYNETKQYLWYPKPHRTVENFVLNVAHHGSWIILIRRHVFAVKNGVIYDKGNPKLNFKKHVIGAWLLPASLDRSLRDLGCSD